MKRIVNGILSMVFLILAGSYGQSAFFAAFSDNARGQSAQTTSYVLFALFLALAIAFGYQAPRSR